MKSQFKQSFPASTDKPLRGRAKLIWAIDDLAYWDPHPAQTQINLIYKDNPGMKYNDFVHAICKPLPRDQHWDHAFMGMLGEVGELTDAIKRHVIYEKPLDLANILEELGDFRFYLEMVVPEVPQDEVDVNTKGRFICLEGTLTPSPLVEVLPSKETYKEIFPATLAELVVKLYKSQSVDDAKSVWVEYERVRDSFKFTEAAVIHSNMNKLSIRYPNMSFSTKDAIERKDKINAEG